MISIDFFGCMRDQIAACSWDEACERFSCTGISIPDASALISLGESLTGTGNFSAKPVPLSAEPFYELSDELQTAVREASADELMDAGARWAALPPWKELDINPMDLAGFLLELQSLLHGQDGKRNSVFLFMESGNLSKI